MLGELVRVLQIRAPQREEEENVVVVHALLARGRFDRGKLQRLEHARIRKLAQFFNNKLCTQKQGTGDGQLREFKA